MPKKGESDPIKEKYWRKQVSDLESSGLGVAEFCRSRGLAYKNFSNWRKRLATKDATRRQVEQDTERVDFAPVHVVETETIDNSKRSDVPFSLEVVLRNGIVLRLAQNCPMKLMSSVISLVGAD